MNAGTNASGAPGGVRTVVVASADSSLRARLRVSLTGLRWQVREANGGAEAMAQMDMARPEALLMDTWLPDLEAGEFAGLVRSMFPAVDLLRVDGAAEPGGVRSPRRNELLHALREARDTGGVVERVELEEAHGLTVVPPIRETRVSGGGATAGLPELVGESMVMQDLGMMIRLVAPRTATVLIEGETGTGKEVVAKAVHRMSARALKSFTVLNCAAIPESLLEAELFGHTRGAFTGAVQSRTGRIEAAHGGTLFLDEIGEMPLGLQAKMLRFLECGELQRVGDNEVMRVDVRVIAATHQMLEKRADEGTFRLDLYHRLAVFPLTVPALRERAEDIPALVEFFLDAMGKDAPRKRISARAIEMLVEYAWPGNVRELMHVLERGAILAGDRQVIDEADIRIRRRR
ncbi:sigma-54-dependent transcriptional regulator [Granulicella sibirica]|uniref:Response regulator of zinc sigma-54-dependent two-component system n=1 Tax=Granulicella sibirica TaxID=2479048 RepID=A0A4Q0T1G2_9BACT|nr:sigma-54 dependent transcriptional regulator [Granulicella sibirica]RXH56622.1 Response regulator of zinc sigma-54-dependent two-component system [Granulicella sibirica]